MHNIKDPLSYYIKEGFVGIFCYPSVTKSGIPTKKGLISTTASHKANVTYDNHGGTTISFDGGIAYPTTLEFFERYGTDYVNESEARARLEFWRHQITTVDQEFREIDVPIIQSLIKHDC